MIRCDVCLQPGPTIHITDAVTAVTSHYHHDCYETRRDQ